MKQRRTAAVPGNVSLDGPCSTSLRCAACLLALFATACADLIGEVTIDDRALLSEREGLMDTSTGSGGMTSSSPPSVSPGEGGVNPDDVTLVGVCERGAVSCSGAALELCVAGGRWITSDICGSPALCQTQPPGCRPPECALDQRSCDGAVLRVCNAARDGWEELERCVSAAHCNPSAPECLAAPCSAGELSCNGNQLQRCADDQLGWVVLDTCETAALCEAAGAAESSACVPPACEAGARRCVEGNLERCNEGRTAFERVEACANNALCELSLENGNALCEGPRCDPGAHLCRGQTLAVCNAERTGFENVDSCGSAALCDATGGSCVPPACALGARRCNGAQIETCNLDRTAFVSSGEAPCASASLCVQGPGGTAACSPPVCEMNQRRCVGARLETCNAELTGFSLLAACASEALCVPIGGGASFDCAEPACSAGQTQCSGSQLATCTADQTAFVTEGCGVLGCNGDVVPARCRTLRDLLP